MLFINKMFCKVPVTSIMHKKESVAYKQLHLYLDISEEQPFTPETVVCQTSENTWYGYKFGNLFQ